VEERLGNNFSQIKQEKKRGEEIRLWQESQEFESQSRDGKIF
jgi:hypothetical protein